MDAVKENLILEEVGIAVDAIRELRKVTIMPITPINIEYVDGEADALPAANVYMESSERLDPVAQLYRVGMTVVVDVTVHDGGADLPQRLFSVKRSLIRAMHIQATRGPKLGLAFVEDVIWLSDDEIRREDRAERNPITRQHRWEVIYRTTDRDLTHD